MPAAGLVLEGHPFDRLTFGTIHTITPLVDLWLEEGCLPSYLRAVPRQGG